MIKLLRAKIAELRDGHVQRASVQVFDNLSRTAIERLQDYGFAAAPTDGNGLVLSVAGHMFILRMDKPTGRPDLGTDEVAVWHKDGHHIILKSGKVIDVDCETFNIKANLVNIDAPNINAPQSLLTTANLKSETANVGGIEFSNHGHDNVESGNDTSGGPVSR